MEKLWSPWRTQYIESFKDKKENSACIFCELAKLEVTDPNNLLINKNQHTFTVLNLYPYNNGHLMIVPYRHIGECEQLIDEENLEIMQMVQLAAKALKLVFKPDGFNIGANVGKVSGAGIEEHIHMHIVPRWSGDTNFMPVLGEVKVISQDLLSTKSKMLDAYSQLK